ncbi:hypothetical protein QOZ80_2BG0186460 [Eleusine coracana subsp. coracana]|nr:hypothetical protein QOZ80_2BG0186460 [Eleusine coracana subsp. coracana]
MSQGPSTPAGGGEGSQRTGAPVVLAEVGGQRSANETMEDLLRDVQGEVDARMALALAADSAGSSSAARSAASAPSSPPRSCLLSPSSLARGLARKILGKAKSSSASSSPTRRSSARSSRGQVPPDLAGTSGSALEAPPRTESVQESMPEQPARTGGVQEARAQQPEATLTRSDFGAKMRSALAEVQVDADGREVQAPFDDMQRAMTGLMELTYGEAELPNPPELPHEFTTKWLHEDDDPLDIRVMKDPIILASGYSVDQFYHQWSASQNICPVTDRPLSHSISFPNDLLRDMIAAWRLDNNSLRSSSSTVKTLPVAPSEEQIGDILQKLSEHSTLQEEGLHEMLHLSKITKGEQPCLRKWPVLIPILIDLKKNWKSTWTHKLEELRLTVILNLSVHRSNKEILAGAMQLPDALKKITDKLPRLGGCSSPSVKVASIVTNLSEFEDFRKRILDIGGMEMLGNLLKIEDVVVRKESVAAICGLCTDEEGKAHAQSCHVTDLLVECLTITDEALVLLDCLQKDPYAVDKLSDKAVELVNIIMADQATGLVTPKALYSAISLVHEIVQQDVSKMETVKNLKDFMERLHELSSGTLPMQTMLKLEKIMSILSEMSPATARQVQS